MVDIDTLERGSELFDDPPLPAASSQFLERSGHHLLFAWEGTDRPAGFISGVEVMHPDKGTEMYVNELAVAALANEAGCYGMWELFDPDNVGALATYRRAGAHEEAPAVVFSWQF